MTLSPPQCVGVLCAGILLGIVCPMHSRGQSGLPFSQKKDTGDLTQAHIGPTANGIRKRQNLCVD